MSNSDELEIEDEQKLNSKFPPGESVLADMGINPATIKFIKPRWKRSHYRAVLNWISEYKPQPDASSLEQIRGYIQALHHLCQLQTWERINIILAVPIKINPPTVNLSIPFYEYLIFQGLYRELLELSQEIINSLENTGNNLNYIILLKGRGLAGTGQLREACQVFEELRANATEGTVPEKSEIYIEATVRLGSAQIQAGRYSEGRATLDKALILIENLSEDNLSIDLQKNQELKIDIMGEYAYYEMNAGRYDNSLRLFTEIVEFRRSRGQMHKLVIPSIYQGIIFRRMKEYERSINHLTEALEKAREINKENQKCWINHHLAYALLNQGNYSLAAEKCQSSLEDYQQREDLRGISDCYEQMGLINLAKGEFYEAENNIERSLTIRQSIGNIHGTASSLKNLAFASWHNKRYLRFMKLLLQSVTMYYKIGMLNRARLIKMLKLAYVWTLGKRNWTS